jgi:hypothetical protein
MSDAEDPWARFRHLPEPIRPEELVETSEVDRLPAEETTKPAWLEPGVGGPGLP